MGKKRKHNTNTRRRRQYGARMRGAENALMQEAKLVDPQTITGLTLLSISEMEEDSRLQLEKREKHALLIKEKEKYRRIQDQIDQKEKELLRIQQEKDRKRDEEKHQEYLRTRKPNYWKRDTTKKEENVGWWNWIFG